VENALAPRILFCDYDGDFAFADMLSRVGYVVDQIRPEALRQVAIGEHQVYVFSFELLDSLSKALKTCEKLKFAELSTPIVLLARQSLGPDFLNHKTTRYAANLYISHPSSDGALLDAMDSVVRCPLPPSTKTSRVFGQDDGASDKMVMSLKAQIAKLESQLSELRGDREKTSREIEEQRDALKPKLKALLEGQKLQFQTESERLKVQLSEVEAKLLDREAKIKDLELQSERITQKIEEITSQHEKAQKTLREFYMSKLKAFESEKKDRDQKGSTGTSG
jgi:hypothetical protein